MGRVGYLDKRVDLFRDDALVLGPGRGAGADPRRADAQDEVRIASECQTEGGVKRDVPRPAEVEDRSVLGAAGEL